MILLPRRVKQGLVRKTWRADGQKKTQKTHACFTCHLRQAGMDKALDLFDRVVAELRSVQPPPLHQDFVEVPRGQVNEERGDSTLHLHSDLRNFLDTHELGDFDRGCEVSFDIIITQELAHATPKEECTAEDMLPWRRRELELVLLHTHKNQITQLVGW